MLDNSKNNHSASYDQQGAPDNKKSKESNTGNQPLDQQGTNEATDPNTPLLKGSKTV